MVRAQLIQDVRLLPNEYTIATAELVGEDSLNRINPYFLNWIH